MKPHNFYKKSLLASSIALVAVGVSPVMAENSLALEEIVVTAQKRAQNLQDVPLSVAVVSGDQIEEMGISDLDTLSTHVPNLNIETSHNPGITIRGIGSGDNEAFEQSVGMYIDGIFMGRWQQYRTALFDMDRVEVLRGPQGILFGKNTIAGAVSMHTARPTAEFEGRLSYSRGFEYGSNDIEAVFSGPLTENLSARLALKYQDEEGYLEDTRIGEDVVEKESQAARLSLAWDPADNLSINLKSEFGRGDNNGDNNSRMSEASPIAIGLFTSIDPQFDLSDEDTTSKSSAASATRGMGLFDELDSYSHALEAVYELENGAELTFVTGKTGYERKYSFDSDFSPADVTWRLREQDFDQLSQEIRFTSPIGDRFNYMAGVFYQKSELKGKTVNDVFSAGPLPAPLAGLLPPPAGNPLFTDPVSFDYDFDQETVTYAAFAQGEYAFDEANTLTVGIRYTNEEKEASHHQYFYDFNQLGVAPTANGRAVLGFFGFDEHNVEDDRSKSSVTGSIKYQHVFNDNLMGYASVATGFKSGGFNEALESYNGPDTFEYDDEEALSFELGLKAELLDGAMRLNAALYHSQLDELQTAQLVGLTFVVSNAGSAIAEGLEIDGQWQATENLFVNFGAAYSHTRYDEFDNAGCTSEQEEVTPPGVDCVQDLGGEPLQFAPDWTASLGFSYDLYASDNLEINSRLDWSFRDFHYLTQANDDIDSQGAYSKTDLGISFNYLPYDLKVDFLASNLFDKRIKRGGNAVTGNGLLIPGNNHYEFAGEPRQFVVRLTKQL